jgi:hypothetical protein
VSYERFYRTQKVLGDIEDERVRQDAKWGEQNHEDGTSWEWDELNKLVHELNDKKVALGELTWRDILHEEVVEAYGETDPGKLRAELVQVAAVAVCWAEAIDRRSAKLREEVEETLDAEGWYGTDASADYV